MAGARLLVVIGSCVRECDVGDRHSILKQDWSSVVQPKREAGICIRVEMDCDLAWKDEAVASVGIGWRLKASPSCHGIINFLWVAYPCAHEGAFKIEGTEGVCCAGIVDHVHRSRCLR